VSANVLLPFAVISKAVPADIPVDISYHGDVYSKLLSSGK
jgi:hypothetical protein